MSRNKPLCMTARTSIKCQCVRFEALTAATDGVLVDIVGNDLRMLLASNRPIVVKHNVDLMTGLKEQMVCPT